MTIHLSVRRTLAYLTDIMLLFAALATTGAVVQRVFGLRQAAAEHVWLAAVLTFSVPTWMYFMTSDRSAGGATAGKWLLGLCVTMPHGARLGIGTSILRTGVKLLPWELVHASAFAFGHPGGALNSIQIAGLAIGGAAALVYFAVAVATGGRRSVHDLAAGTCVQRRRLERLVRLRDEA
ncbi:MAG: RDD family protein [Acidobacteria bacterium]|nr:RDD family protein [Acidobacteriota bacterium]